MSKKLVVPSAATTTPWQAQKGCGAMAEALRTSGLRTTLGAAVVRDAQGKFGPAAPAAMADRRHASREKMAA